MDQHHPHLIGDCLIHIFTFLNEEDLMLVSSVCKVGSVQLAEVGCIQNNTRNPANNLFNNYIFLGLARSCRDSLVVEVGYVCTFSIWCTSDRNVHVNLHSCVLSQEAVSAALEFLQLCRPGQRRCGSLVEEIFPATFLPGNQDDGRTVGGLHLQKPQRTHG